MNRENISISGKKRIGKRILLVLAVLLIAMGIGTAVYISDYYHASDEAWQVLDATADYSVITIRNGKASTADMDQSMQETVRKADVVALMPVDSGTKMPDGNIQYEENPGAGIIFYPGGKVEMEAYLPLMKELAERDICCVLVRMPGNLAVFNPNAAGKLNLKEQFPQIEHWYIGGHSLGGAMAASYAGKNPDVVDGLILLAAYSTADLTDTDLDVLLIRGTEDGVLGIDKYNECLANLPEDYSEVVIEGGCHAYFGSYGAQKGDGTPAISPEEQQEITADSIINFIS